MRVPQVSERIKEVPAQALRGVFAGIGQLLLVTDKLRNKAPAAGGVPKTRAPESSETVAGKGASQTADQREEAAAPVQAEPVRAEPLQAEPVQAEPVQAEPVQAEPLQAEPVQAEPLQAEPLQAEPVRTEPVSVEPAPAQAEASKAAKAPVPAQARDFDRTGNVRLLGDEEEAAVSAAASARDAASGDTATAEGDLGDAVAPLPNYDGLSVASLRARLRNFDIAQVRQMAEYERAHAARTEVIGMFERRISKLEAEAEVEREAQAERQAQAKLEAEAEPEAEA